MNLPKKIAAKIYIEPSSTPDAHRLVELFHGWIKAEKLGELMVDVVDYGHVHEGPSVLLVGHESDYAFDLGEGRVGIYYQRKRASEPADGDHARDGIRRLLKVAALLEQETKIRFKTDELLLKLLDRRAAPNEVATVAALQPEVDAIATRLFGTGTARPLGGDPREALSFRISAAGAVPTLADLVSRA